MRKIQKIDGVVNRIKEFEAVSFNATVEEHFSVEVLTAVTISFFCMGKPTKLALYEVEVEDDRLLFLSGDVGGHILDNEQFVDVSVAQNGVVVVIDIGGQVGLLGHWV